MALFARVRGAAARVRMSAAVKTELAALLALALPVCATFVLGFGLVLVNTLVVGHTGAQNLAAAALGSMFANAFGNSILFGTSAACDTLQSQAYGAKNYARVGHVSQRGLVILLTLAVPIALLWWNSRALLEHFGQDEVTVDLATQYVRWLLPGLPASLAYEIFKKHLQNIGIMVPAMVIQVLAICCNAILAFVLVYHSSLGFYGAPLSTAVAQWLSLMLALVYLKFHRPLNALGRLISDKIGVKRNLRRVATASVKAMRTHSMASMLKPRGLGTVASMFFRSGPAAAGSAAASGNADQAQSSTPSLDDSDTEDGAISLQVTTVDDSTLDVDSEATPAPGETPRTPDAEPSTGQTPLAAAPSAAADPATQQAVPPDHLVADDVLDIDERIDRTLVPFSPSIAFSGWVEFLGLGLPSALMLLSEWGSYETVAIFAGMVSTLVLASHTIIAMTASLSFMPVLGLSVAASVRIGQQMGERKPAGAAFTYRVVLMVVLAYAALNAMLILAVQSVWARVFTDDAEVVQLISRWLWLLALYVLFDGLQGVCSGALRGVGRPAVAAGGNVLAYLVVGLPLSYTFALRVNAGLPGLWSGFIIAVTVAFIVLGTALHLIDWEKEAKVAHERATRDMIQKQSSGQHAASTATIDENFAVEIAGLQTAGNAPAALTPSR